MRLEDRLPALADFIASAAGAEGADIVACTPLSGGAIQENWSLSVSLRGGPKVGHHDLVLRTDAPSAVALSRSRAEEFALLVVAHEAGIAVPEPLWLCTDSAILGQPFFLMRRAAGVAAGHLLVKDASIDRPALLRRLGAELANIHAIQPPQPKLAFLGKPSHHPALDRIGEYRRHLDTLGLARPALEYGLAWAERHAPEPERIVLVHQDFRTGNYLVDGSRLTAILDWEFAAWGDPDCDIGWFCARCWRFGAIQREAGGIGDRTDFVRSYEAASRRRVDPARVRFWEIMAHLRWAVAALLQSDRHLSGSEFSLELALTGRIPAELELEALRLIDAADPVAAS